LNRIHSARRRAQQMRRSAGSRRSAGGESRAALRLVICGVVFVLLVAVKLLFPEAVGGIARSAGRLIGRDADFLGGRFSIQGEGSMMACMAAEVKPGMQVLDACAAPGGKTCLMAEMMNGTGRVQAWELHPHRTELIAAQAKRLHLENIRPMTRDATRHREELDQTMDVVLLDAPCSGLGVMADKPDVKYRVTESSLAELTQTQAALLDTVAPYVKRGGRLVYSTCSILRMENEDVVTAAIRSGRAELVPIDHPMTAHLPLLPTSLPGTLCVCPDGLHEGFFAAKLRKKR